MTETCKNCRFWGGSGQIGMNNGWPTFACRRHAPTVIARASGNANYQNPETSWPGTSQQDWCGDWEPVDATVTKA